ncbi:MAG: choice-of-anchor L domain-containing protein [Clostridia bacterium]|nr:choice-of-anchor L domain-containing protein [Clostridia bacterium]
MVSEEVTEFVGSRYDDAFAVYAVLRDGTKVELMKNSINTATWKDSASEKLTTIDFPGGDTSTYQTGWIFCDLDLSSSGIDPFDVNSIVFAVTDVGDSEYDTVVLIDDVEFD